MQRWGIVWSGRGTAEYIASQGSYAAYTTREAQRRMVRAEKDLRSVPGEDFEWACLCKYFEEEECIGIPAARPLLPT